MAQLVARLVRIEEVRGSNPLRSTGITKRPSSEGRFHVYSISAQICAISAR